MERIYGISAENIALLRKMRAKQRAYFHSKPRNKQLMLESLVYEREVDSFLAGFPADDAVNLFSEVRNDES